MPRSAVCISIVHYHLEPGGVTKVIDLSVQALTAHLDGLREVRLVSGRPDGVEKLADSLRSICGQVRIVPIIVPEIDYLPIGTQPGPGTDTAVNAMKNAMLKACAGSIWWIHNYHLGKNPLFTKALLEITKENPRERFCFHIHDFPESSRYDNLNFLRRFVGGSPYPQSANIRYAVINGRDFANLKSAGLVESSVYLLNNPIKDESFDKSRASETARKLERIFGGKFPGYIPGAPLMVYPVRTIRRKNALELGLLAAISREPVNLVVTLPGTSESEKPYSDLVAKAFEEGLIPGMWGIGASLDEEGIRFMDLVSAARLICSSSVQEGFGYLFINAVQWKIPLFARYLTILDGIVDVFREHPHLFYTTIHVPIENEHRRKMRNQYEKKIDRLTSAIPSARIEALRSQAASLGNEGTVDFSYFAAEEQIEILRRTSNNRSYKNGICQMNNGILKELENLTHLGTLENAPPVSSDWPFSFRAFAETVGNIIDSYESPPRVGPAQNVQENLIARFAELADLRLIFGE
ncbi:MAG: hypothetical protein HN368_14870 [Spirochaetales bacterium]|jgi:hypothetical protein|nr:hypothetical protein [Spirochaetales bacterium]